MESRCFIPMLDVNLQPTSLLQYTTYTHGGIVGLESSTL